MSAVDQESAAVETVDADAWMNESVFCDDELVGRITSGATSHHIGNCLSMAAAVAVFDVLERDRLVERAAELGDHAVRRLRDLAGRCDKIKEVRGKGLFIGVELTEPGRPIVDKCLQRNVMINVTQDTVLRLAPPLVISRRQLDEGLDTLEEIIAS